MIENRKLTFSQREGKVPLPEPMRPEYISQDFRNQIWEVIVKAINREEQKIEDLTTLTWGCFYIDNSPICSIIREYTIKVLKYPFDHIRHVPFEHQKLLKPIILEKSYDSVFTLIEFILRQNYGPLKLYEDLENAFQEISVAYVIQNIDSLPTIMLRLNKESGAGTQKAIETIEQKGSAGAKKHFRLAVEAVNKKDYAGAIRESIHAVESITRTIDPNTNTLGSALNSLEKMGVLKHPALKMSLGKLYAYANDVKGIRHALKEKALADVDLNDAIFMFSVCASWAAYLVNKHEQVKSNAVDIKK